VYDLDAVAEMMESFDATDLWPALEEATVPIHLVRGSRSRVWSSDELAHLRELPKGTVDLTVLDAGHWLHVDAPGALLDVLRLPARG
jgi:pimeloyl-ACP methyl ester carboxylesterase